MMLGSVVVLDGRREADDDLSSVADVLADELRRAGATVRVFELRDVKMGSCQGCFGCWLETPGVCVESDIGREISRAVVQSDTTVLLSPVTFGGYTSEIKKAQDRWLPLVLPDFGVFHDEVHHVPRYSRYPRFVGIGIQRDANDEEANLFKLLVGRNALNFHCPSYAAEVVLSSDDRRVLQQEIHDALGRHDAPPLIESIRSLMPAPEATNAATRPLQADRPRRALLLVGSPKIKSPSTSGALGGHVLHQLEQHGFKTERMTLKRNILKDRGRTQLLDAVDRADLVLLAFPLYIDSLPFLMMRALEMMAEHGTVRATESEKRLFVIANNGFPEAEHNAVALAICRRFAMDTGMIWSGGLAMGAGEMLFSGKPVDEAEQAGRPVKHVIEALEIACAALADGRTVPPKAADSIAKTPAPQMSPARWRDTFIEMANQHWRRSAAEHQVGAEDLPAQPYAETGSATQP